MMKYDEPNMEIILINEKSDVITLSVLETEEVEGEQWWSGQ